MEWLGSVLIGMLTFTVVVQLLWAHSLSVIARKTELGSLMEVLAWVPLAQVAPMLAVGGGSLPHCLLGTLGLIAANGALLAVGVFLGEGLGAVLPAIGIGATMLISLGYFARIYWNTATARELPGWVGLLMFVPLVNLFAYPIMAFHDGWAGPHKIGLLIGTLITVGSMAPYYTALQLLQEGEGLPTSLADWQAAGELRDLGRLDEMPVEIVIDDRLGGPGGASVPLPAEIARDHEQSIRALFEMKDRFDQLEALAAPENMLIEDLRGRALRQLEQLRAKLASQRTQLDPQTYEELATHLIEIEARIHSEDARGGRARFAKATRDSGVDRTDAGRPASLAGEADADPAPIRPFPVRASDGCPRNTELRSRTTAKGDEEWCQQLEAYGGLRHGWYARYFEGGRPEQIGEYSHGLRVGVWTRFYPSGGVRAQAEFRRGMQHGWLLTFDPSGEREKAVRFEEGTALR